jgi:hypothetical protein
MKVIMTGLSGEVVSDRGQLAGGNSSRGPWAEAHGSECSPSEPQQTSIRKGDSVRCPLFFVCCQLSAVSCFSAYRKGRQRPPVHKRDRFHPVRPSRR